MERGPRTADPWRDTDVIDRQAPRFNQAVTGLVALAGVLFGWPLAWALMALQLLIGVTLGRRFCLPCLAYFMVVQPRFGEGPLEDARPPRLANMVGIAFLGSAAAAWWLGAETAGTVLGAVVAALALLAAATGFCAGCELYRLTARLRGISPTRHSRIEPADLAVAAAGGPDVGYVEFSHPLCAECREWERRLGERPERLLVIDVRERPDLARKYGIAVVPTVVAVAADGEVLERLAP
jgi:tellurite resistance protein